MWLMWCFCCAVLWDVPSSLHINTTSTEPSWLPKVRSGSPGVQLPHRHLVLGSVALYMIRKCVQRSPFLSTCLGGGGSGVQTGCPGQSQLLGVEVLKFEIWPRRGSGGKRRGPLLSPGWSCPLCIGWLLVDHFPSHKLM